MIPERPANAPSSLFGPKIQFKYHVTFYPFQFHLLGHSVGEKAVDLTVELGKQKVTSDSFLGKAAASAT